ncbi:MAG: 2-oxoacid:acceptor oxidoreductase subunit alpha [Candidatus Dormiibacterota bacterium]
MARPGLAVELAAAVGARANEFAIKLANVNGTGSASTNGLLMEAIFRMGVAVSGKNLFPSNIQGLPTWYEIRVSASGHIARASEYDLMVAMNGQTYDQDIAEVREGGYLLYDDSWPLESHQLRPGVNFLGVPLAQLCADRFDTAAARALMKNVATAGVLVALLGLPLDEVAVLLERRYERHRRLLEDNQAALRLGYEYATVHLSCPLPFHVVRLASPGGRILIDGNTAVALGAIYAGATVAAWYPITPSTSVMESFSRLCAQYRQGPKPAEGESRRHDYLIIQAEDELAALGMVIGASWAGARAFTSTSGPGLSLMQELLGLAYYTEVPAVVVDVQRAGPSTGMPTRVQQADILAAVYASHGDTQHIVLFPADPTECFYFTVQAFDLAERFQTPVLLLTDLDIGMNDWDVPELTWDDSYRPDRGRVLGREELESLDHFWRYGDADPDGIAARTLPGVSPRGGHLIRGSGHNRRAAYTENPSEYLEVVDRLRRKHEAAASHLPSAVVEVRPDADLGVITVGSCDAAVREAMELIPEVPLSYLRVRGYPFGAEVGRFIEEHRFCFVVEQNRDGQLRSLLQIETGAAGDKLRPLLSYGGLPLTAGWLAEQIARQLEA